MNTTAVLNNTGTSERDTIKRKTLFTQAKKHLPTAGILLAMIIGFLAINSNGFALADPGEVLWTTIVGVISTWVTRLGGVVFFIGGVMFGLGWKSDDAEQKSRGVSTMVAAGIVLSVAGLTATFFA